MTWVPPDIGPVCASTQANLTACSMGVLYLSLLQQLFRKPADEQINYEYVINPILGKFGTNNFRRKHVLGETNQHYDFIIVGAGSAGCVLANRLSEIKQWRILLIEAGEAEPEVTSIPGVAPSLSESNIDWKYKTQPDGRTCLLQKGQVCPWFRGKTMGGSSAINYMVYMRGSSHDYDGWAAEGNDGWSYEEVLPYFDKSINLRDYESLKNNDYHGIGGELNVERFRYLDGPSKILVKGFRDKGLPIVDLGLESKVGVNINLSASKDGKRQSTNQAFIKPIRDERTNLHIITNAFATKILIHPAKKEAYGIQYFKDGKYYNVFANKEVIVSSGALNSPKLLKCSGVGPRDELESLGIPIIADLKVGYNLQDHVTTDALILKFSNQYSTVVNDSKLLNEVIKYRNQPEKKSGPLSSTTAINSIAFINTKGSKDDPPNVQFHFDGRRAAEYLSDPTNYMASNILPVSFYDSVGARPLLLNPRSRGNVLLNKSDPIFGSPLIYTGFFQVQEDIDDLLDAIRFVISLDETEAFKKAGASFDKTPVKGCDHNEWGTDDYFKCLLMNYTATIYHPAGTCKMGPEWEEDAVVDPRFKVHGIRRLRVVDASTMRTIVRGNLNAPTIMMAEKASDMIKEDHRILTKTNPCNKY
ncbi:glucose dehydrogenase [FAD, quinone]-like isoform X2 [Pieris brassicae]|uniref:glucose dehydrogenase [FAD, quinone]-like isoform X2 n=1 Tax=Pieris brassicae TaxID=7116 RepID=UPI001E661B7F|nr:glucose dehydrogenase [FAD, quinone]-like isoform X2 [Pieris brassicae]XP_045518874.1 glucose dehydrogenase [FAD, quinone]-like isoform X2 [Pieris brassicae]XP_045518875.1 glucose dehydrogenase [FAD, quinone]-like isoform X2 [Pieris brassicae]